MAKLHDMRLKLLIQQEHERISKSQPNDLDLSIVQARCLCWLALLAELTKIKQMMLKKEVMPSKQWDGLLILCCLLYTSDAADE